MYKVIFILSDMAVSPQYKYSYPLFWVLLTILSFIAYLTPVSERGEKGKKEAKQAATHGCWHCSDFFPGPSGNQGNIVRMDHGESPKFCRALWTLFSYSAVKGCIASCQDFHYSSQSRPKRTWWHLGIKLVYKTWQDSCRHPGVRGKWRQHEGFYVCNIRYLEKMVKVYSNWPNLLRCSFKFRDEHIHYF